MKVWYKKFYEKKEIDFPLKGNYEFSKFKLYYNDIGLSIASLDDYASNDLRVNKNMSIHKGGLFENAIGSLLYKMDLIFFVTSMINQHLKLIL